MAQINGFVSDGKKPSLEKEKTMDTSNFSFSSNASNYPHVNANYGIMCYLFPNKPWFYMSAKQVFLNTAGKGEIARNKQFLLFHSVFYPFGEHSTIFIKYEIVCKLFAFWRV